MRHYNYLIAVGIAFIILISAFSFSIYSNNVNNNLIFFEYKMEALSNLQRGTNDFIIKSQFVKSDNWKKCENKLPLCETGTYINRIGFDSTQLNEQVSFNDILQSLFTYIERGESLNDGLPLKLDVNNNLITIIVFLRHKHEQGIHSGSKS